MATDKGLHCLNGLNVKNPTTAISNDKFQVSSFYSFQSIGPTAHEEVYTQVQLHTNTADIKYYHIYYLPIFQITNGNKQNKPPTYIFLPTALYGEGFKHI